ncbi:MAG: hypothetical protein IT435_13610 [Phycisphaerales bacterium]|nr:hypothetical protein [Phycisphaerales bacterium]
MTRRDRSGLVRGMVSAAALVAACGSAHAQPADWANAATGFWNTAANWDPAVVPDGASFDVTINKTGSLYDVTLDIDPTIGTLNIDSFDATMQLNNRTLNIVGAFDLTKGLIRGNGSDSLVIGGLATFTGDSGGQRDVLGPGSMTFNGDVEFNLGDDVDICDTDVGYNGNAVTWDGNGNMRGGLGAVYTFSSTTTFSILNDRQFLHNGFGAAPSIINNGTIIKSTGTGTTEFLDVSLSNVGTLQVDVGTIKSNGVLTPGNTLTSGTWKVMNSSTLDLVGNTITTNAADIELSGANASFAAINGLSTNSAGATFRLSSGRNFSTAGAFANNGTLNVGAATQFTATSTLAQGSSTITGGGTVQVNGAAIFSGPTTAPVIDLGTTVKTAGDVQISGASGLRLDTGGKLQHAGTTGTWSGGGISMGDSSAVEVQSGATLTASNDQSVTWDNTGARPTFNVQGTFIKSTGAGTTAITGTSLLNTGEIRVESGTLSADQPPVVGGNLAAGKWLVKNNSTLDFVATSVTTNSAEVTIDGTGSSFSALENNLLTNATSGVLTLAGGKDITTTGAFTNDGKLNMGAGSTFEVDSGSALSNYNGGTETLTGGEINVTSTNVDPGSFKWVNPGFKIKNLAAKISLSGADSLIDNGTRANESALNELATITDVGTFELHDTREFRPEGDLEVQELGANKGRLVIGETSLLEIQDTFTLINFNTGTGEMTNGDFDIGGTLSFPGAIIKRVSNIVTLAGTGQIINKTTGLEAFSGLEYVAATGDFTVRGGKDLDITPLPSVGPANTLQIDGRLAVGPGASGNDSVVTVHGNFQQNDGSLVEIFEGGVLDIQGVGPGTGNYTADTGSTLNMQGGTIQVQDTFTANGILGGDGVINGNVVINGEFQPGNSVGRMAIGGSLVMSPTSQLFLNIAGYGEGIGFDKIVVDGPMFIDTGAQLTILPVETPDFQFAYGQLFRVIDAGFIGNHFAPENVFGTQLGGGLYLKLDWNDPTALRIVVVPAPSVMSAGMMGAIGLGIGGRRRRR